MNKLLDDPLSNITAQLQKEVLYAVLPVFITAAIVLLDSARWNEDVLWRLSVGVSIILISIGIIFIQRKNIQLALWVQVISSIILCFLVARLSQMEILLALLIFPIGVFNLYSQVKSGAAITVFCSLCILLTPSNLLLIESSQKSLFIALIWGVFGMIWLVKRPLLSTAQDALISSRRSFDLLEQARDIQGELQKSLKELAESNAQMIRLNKLAQGLRQVAEEERRTKEEFVANVSHELRTPLNMIIGFCEMILNTPDVYGDNIPVTLLSDLEVVLRNSQHLSGLIDDVLDLSQIDSGRIALEKEKISLEEIIDEAVVSVRPLFQSKGLSLQTNVQGPLPTLFGDRTRMREVLLNLLSNAGRFTEQGGVQIRAWLQDNSLFVSIADTGIGISPEEKARLFRPFQQADGSIHRRYSGTGLGLSISKSLVELHDGRMWVESEKGKGTTFFFRLPVDPIELPTTSALRWVNSYQPNDAYEPPDPSIRGNIKPRVLVVEKGIALQKILKRQLHNVDVLTAKTMTEAIKTTDQSPVRALIVNSPGGEETALLTENLPYKLPVFSCSVPETDAVVLEMGVAAYLVKPVDRKRLISIIEGLPAIKTILVVDDDPETQRLIKRMLATSEKHYQILRAMNGEQGFEILQRTEVDLILLDFSMPKMDGMKFLEIKQQQAEISDIPVILISARDPYGQPIISKYLSVTGSGGLSAHQLVSCLEAVIAVLSPPEKTVVSTSSAISPG